MNGIDKIIERILNAADLERDKILADAGIEAARVFDNLKDQADAEALETVSRGEDQAKRLVERLEGSQELENRKMILDTKQKMVDSAMERAKSMLWQLPDDEYSSLLARIAIKAVVTGDEIVVLGKKDLARVGSTLKDKIIKLAAQMSITAAVTISPVPGDFDNGLIVRQGNIETNCSFDTIFRMLRDNMAGDVAKTLFS